MSFVDDAMNQRVKNRNFDQIGRVVIAGRDRVNILKAPCNIQEK